MGRDDATEIAEHAGRIGAGKRKREGKEKGGVYVKKVSRKRERVSRELSGSDLCSPHPGTIRATLPVPCGDAGGMKM